MKPLKKKPAKAAVNKAATSHEVLKAEQRVGDAHVLMKAAKRALKQARKNLKKAKKAAKALRREMKTKVLKVAKAAPKKVAPKKPSPTPRKPAVAKKASRPRLPAPVTPTVEAVAETPAGATDNPEMQTAPAAN